LSLHNIFFITFKKKILVEYKIGNIDYLQNLIYSLESIKNISAGITNLAAIYTKELSEIPIIIENIKG